MWARILAFLRSWGVIALLIAAGLAFAARFIAPPLPDVIRIATGQPGGAYAEAGEIYAAALRREGFRVELLATEGAGANLDLLRQGRVDLALVQGGITTAEQSPGLVSLGSIFQEAAWAFIRHAPDLPPGLHLAGRRIAMGPDGSGSRRLALALLALNGVDMRQITALPLAGMAAAEALLAGEVDAAVFVSAVPSPPIARLLRATDQVVLLDFRTRAAAYAMQMPYLNPVRLPRSGFSLADDLPTEEVTLMAPAAYVAARADVNDQVAALMVRIMQDVHRGRQLFAMEGRFPHGLNQDLPLQRDAARSYEQGSTFLQRYLPFHVAVQIERLWVLAIPLVTLALPLLRFGPQLYRWQMEGRVYRWYDTLRRIEAAQDRPGADKAALLRQLAQLEGRVAGTSLPAAYARHLFALRRDIAYVRERLSG